MQFFTMNYDVSQPYILNASLFVMVGGDNPSEIFRPERLNGDIRLVLPHSGPRLTTTPGGRRIGTVSKPPQVGDPALGVWV
jgi:hypothetical protein